MVFKVGRTEFTSKKSAEQFFKALRDHYADCIELNPEDFNDALELLQLHPNARSKIGAGVDAIFVAQNAKGNGREYKVRRIDGTIDNFRFQKCITHPVEHYNLMDACRGHVADQISSFRTLAFASDPNPVCPVNGDLLIHENSDVDHYPISFRELVFRWLNSINLDLGQVEITGEAQHLIKDKTLRSSWIEFHAQNAGLRLTSSQGNRSRQN